MRDSTSPEGNSIPEISGEEFKAFLETFLGGRDEAIFEFDGVLKRQALPINGMRVIRGPGTEESGTSSQRQSYGLILTYQDVDMASYWHTPDYIPNFAIDVDKYENFPPPEGFLGGILSVISEEVAAGRITEVRARQRTPKASP